MMAEGFRIIFMGTPDFAVAPLRALLASDHQVIAVVTQPDKRKGRGKKLAPPPAKVVAEEHEIPVLQPYKIKTDEFLLELSGYDADLIVVAAYGRILPASILKLCPLGCINVHASLLPRHRGAAPIQWAVMEGDSRTGVTIMQMNEGMDTGDILFTASIDMAEDETAGSLFAKLSQLGSEALLTTLAMLKNSEITPVPQDHDLATKAPPLKKEMGRIDWSLPADKLHRLIRGLDPWPSAYTFLKGRRYRLFSPGVIHKKTDALPGTILMVDKEGIVVAAGRDALLIRELQPEGRKRLSAEAYLHGHSFEPGSRFDNG